MHIPSEHTVQGKHYDAELHIVHHYKGTDDQLGAVIAIFFDVPRINEDDDDHSKDGESKDGESKDGDEKGKDE